MNGPTLQRFLGANLERYRRERGLTQAKLAEAGDISLGHLSDIIHSRRWVSADVLAKLSNALEIEPWSLFFEPSYPKSGMAEHIAAEKTTSHFTS